MTTILPDVPTTRRLRLHYVLNEHDEVTFTSPSMADVIEYLLDQGITTATFQNEQGKRYLLTWELIA